MHFLLCYLGKDIPLTLVSVFIAVKWELNIYRDQRLWGKDLVHGPVGKEPRIESSHK